MILASATSLTFAAPDKAEAAAFPIITTYAHTPTHTILPINSDTSSLSYGQYTATYNQPFHLWGTVASSTPFLSGDVSWFRYDQASCSTTTPPTVFGTQRGFAGYVESPPISVTANDVLATRSYRLYYSGDPWTLPGFGPCITVNYQPLTPTLTVKVHNSAHQVVGVTAPIRRGVPIHGNVVVTGPADAASPALGYSALLVKEVTLSTCDPLIFRNTGVLNVVMQGTNVGEGPAINTPDNPLSVGHHLFFVYSSPWSSGWYGSAYTCIGFDIQA